MDFFPKVDGGDVNENHYYIEGKWVAHCQKNSILKKLMTKWQFVYIKNYGGDVNENRYFIEGKWVAHGQKIAF